MANRYERNKIITSNLNDLSLKEVIESRSVKSISHFNTSNLKFPTIEQISSFRIVKYTWKSNDKYWKLSTQFYGDPKYWWVIAWFNKKPLESMINMEEQISIPLPLIDVLEAVIR
jgi:nucleoid-associated protein YgaU